MIDKTVSIVVPAYKMGKYISAALQSVSNQTHRDWEIIVVDDCGPDDGTARIVSDFAEKHPSRRVEFIRHQVNKGLGGTRNTAINAASGDLVAFLDPDDVWLPHHLEKIFKAFKDDADIAVVSTPVEAFYEKADGEFLDPLMFESWQLAHFPDSLAVGSFLQPSATVVKREALLKIGGFDTHPKIHYVEDVDLWIRLIEAGFKFKFINTISSRYRKHPDAATSNPEMMRTRHGYLVEKHASFFIYSQSRMLRSLMVKNHRMKQRLKHPVKTMISLLFSK